MQRVIIILFAIILICQDVMAQSVIYLPIVFKNPQPEKLKGTQLTDEHMYCSDLSKLDVDWYYINSPYPAPDCREYDSVFVPSIFRVWQVDSALLPIYIENAKPSGWLMTFDEPNLHGVTPHAGAIYYRKVEQVAIANGLKIVAPNPSQHDRTWIWRMVAEYETLYGHKPHFDAVAVGIYETTPAAMKSYIMAQRNDALARGYNVPVWVVAYAGHCWNTDTAYPTGNYAIMTQVTPWIINQVWIDRYMWFTNRISGQELWALNHQSCSLLDWQSGEYTQLGGIYAAY